MELRGAARGAMAVLLCGSLLAAAAEPPRLQPSSAYLEGAVVHFSFQPLRSGQRFRVGPWDFGPRSSDTRPRDRRLNLYLVAPGVQQHADGWEDFDHDLVINALPKGEEPAEFDVYWAIVLDPALQAGFAGEHDLLHARQERFLPHDLFEFSDIPGHAFLRAFLKIESLHGLAAYRRSDSSLPRLLIVPAGAAVRMSVSPSAAAEGTSAATR